ncbi:RidA family protein [Streptomyces sp. NPDC014870]|uniref:RidA family protein n=1 Tax=Streptomyces sp. NPDC014870 TaxID=3364925 RepID=UPI0036FC98C1
MTDVSRDASHGAPHRVRVTADPDWYAPAGIALGIRVGNLVLTSGQGPIDPHGGTVGAGDFEAQARQALANLGLVLKNAGSGLDQVVKATVFVTDIARDQEVFARVRAEHFAPHTIAESFVEVSSLADPDWLIEIEAIAVAEGAVTA